MKLLLSNIQENKYLSKQYNIKLLHSNIQENKKFV